MAGQNGWPHSENDPATPMVPCPFLHAHILFSVMEKLPATSYVRLVDMWLIFGQLLPFIQVVFTLTLPCIDLNMQHTL